MAVTTDERGVFRLPTLAPGDYTLEIELANFSRYREAGIQVDVQARLERSITLKVAGIEESISVEGGSDVDAQRTRPLQPI